MMLRTLAIGLCSTYLLSACATATRGSTTMLIVNSTPPGATVTTNEETKQSLKNTSKQQRLTAVQNNSDMQFTYYGCSPTPCGIEIPRKSEFGILVSKEGYTSQTLDIAHVHRKDVTNKNVKDVAVGTGAAAAAGGATAALAGLEILGTSLAAPFALAAAIPIVAIGGTALAVDAASGANYDLTPNPANIKLEPFARDMTEEDDLIRQQFQQRRNQLSSGAIKKATCSRTTPKIFLCGKNDEGEDKYCKVTKNEKFPCYLDLNGEAVN